MRLLWAGVSICVLSATPALAGGVPLTQPAPGWVDKAPLDLAHLDADSPEILVLDTQEQIAADGTLWTYTDKAVRVASPKALEDLATLMLSWSPDKGDLIIHEAAILRDGNVIDLLAGGKSFTVLRREESLEALELTGILTATMPAEGLRVGDVLRLRTSITLKDKALAGHADVVDTLPAAPRRLGFGRVRVEWAGQAQWHALGKAVAAKPWHAGGFSGIEVTLPVAKQPDMPKDAPARFQTPPLIEVSTFADWPDVSRTMAPLFATDGLIAPGSPLAGVLAEVKAAPTPMARTALALRHVQDDIRYLALSMGSGNYVPQKPADTWTKRYGDCKAKALLLLALLRGAGIEAEPVLVHASLGDMLPGRLPSAAAFNHVIVRATVDGQVLWLDGTDTGTRIEDLPNTPAFAHVLPLRPAGSGLIDVPLRPMARPQVEISVDADESGSVDLPSVVTAKVILRGQIAAPLFAASARMDAKQRDKALGGFFDKVLSNGQWTDLALTTDPASGTATVSGRGEIDSPWQWEDKRFKRDLDKLLTDFTFAPDRARPEWAELPTAIAGPTAATYHLTLHVPGGGAGATIDGTGDASERFAGQTLTRHTVLDKGVLTFDERSDSLGGEIPASAIPDERDKADGARAALPHLRLTRDTPREWDVPANDRQLAAVETILAAAIARREPDDASAILFRASVRKSTGNPAGALADYTEALTINPTADLYLDRSYLLHQLGRDQEALADAQKARGIDPASRAANGQVATMLAITGDLPGALALLDRRIALGGEHRDAYRESKADVLGFYGDAAQGLAMYDTLLADKPNDADVLNSRCWVKALRNVQLDTALKDCTSAIELNSESWSVLDSRAVVWFRMGRYAEALQDIGAVLTQRPGLSQSLYVRGVIETRQGDKAKAAIDLAAARRIDPGVDRFYTRFGIQP